MKDNFAESLLAFSFIRFKQCVDDKRNKICVK